MMASSPSVAAREKGNEVYRGALQPGLAPVVHRTRLLDALVQYNKSLQHASLAEERCSSFKNIGIVHARLCGAFGEVQAIKECKYHAVEGINSFGEAQRWGVKATKARTWQTDVVARAIALAAAFCDPETCPASLEDRVNMLSVVLYSPLLPLAKAPKEALTVLNLRLADMRFKCATVLRGEDDFLPARTHITEMERPLLATRKHFREVTFLEDIAALENKSLALEDFLNTESETNVLLGDMRLEHTRLEAMQHIELGEEELRVATEDSEDLQMVRVWQALDMFRYALVCSADCDVEAEAIANSKVGTVYSKILKQPTHGLQYFKKAVTLGLSMTPRTFHNVPWFKEAREAVQAAQEEADRRDQEKIEAERKPFLEELKKELEELKVVSDKDDANDLLAHVYTKHPPKKESNKRDTEKPLKKQLQMACVHYHPDSNRSEQHGRKWTVLCEELVKVLTRVYERHK